GSFGAGNYAMAGRAYDPRFIFTWPNSQISVMGGEQAAKTLLQIRMKSFQRKGESLSEVDQLAFRQKIEAEYLEQGNAYYATSELWDDGVIDPLDTRNVLGMAISASLNAPFEKAGYGVMRI
ncbi:MAG: carboxyl transferase domain-containing protein, partial [Chloroflexota bacterium]